jgi:hypothetical protein
VAAFVEQYLWATHNHEKYFLTYEEFKNTDFWSFFHITEKERSLEENNFTTIELRTKAFQSEVKLCVTLDVQQRVIEAGLGLKRKWLIGPPFGLNPFALDIARSFIATFIPPPEQQQMKELITKFSDIQKPNYAQQVLLEKTDEALLTYLGAAPTFFLMSDFSCISIENFILETEPWLRIKINISIPIYLTTSKPLRVDRQGLT